MIGSEDDAAAQAPLITAFVQEVLDSARRLAIADSRTPGDERLTPPFTAVLDEIASICPLPDLPDTLSDSAGRGVLIHYALQSPAQAQARWGKAAATLFDNTTALTILGGLKSEDTLKWASLLVGRRLEERRSRQAGRELHRPRLGPHRQRTGRHPRTRRHPADPPRPRPADHAIDAGPDRPPQTRLETTRLDDTPGRRQPTSDAANPTDEQPDDRPGTPDPSREPAMTRRRRRPARRDDPTSSALGRPAQIRGEPDEIADLRRETCANLRDLVRAQGPRHRSHRRRPGQDRRRPRRDPACRRPGATTSRPP